MEWQPISTAPLDGTEFDVWCPEPGGGYRVANAYWSTVDAKWQWQGQGDRMQWAHQPTHWMPLPTPPEQPA